MSAEQTVMIASLHEFVQLLQSWHTQQVKAIEHFKDIPEGSEVSDDDNTPVVLAGEARKGFILGLKTALNFIGELPFVAELEEIPATEEAQSQPESDPAQASLDLESPEPQKVH